jgi:predicted glycogen debranching enzyme
MSDPILRIDRPTTELTAKDALSKEDDPTSPFVTREWLVTNGLGGYASGTIAGLATRRFHGLLVAALPAPLGRTMLLSHVSQIVRLADGRAAQLGAQPALPAHGAPLPVATLLEFRLEMGLPVWRYEAFGVVFERCVWMRYGQNVVFASYELVESREGPVRLEIEPWVRFRPHEGALDAPMSASYALTVEDDRYEVTSDGYPPLRMRLDGKANTFTIDKKRMRDVGYLMERTRGYDSIGELYSPGFFCVSVEPGSAVTFAASADSHATLSGPSAGSQLRATRLAEIERREQLLLSAEPAAREGMAADLVLAADQFLITPARRADPGASMPLARDDARTVIAGYHWFTDWGRDTMISLEGLTLVTGRVKEAGYILRTFADYERDGLIPNLFPEHGSEGLYHTADATLWFFHAIDRYLEYTGDREMLRLLLPKLVAIADHHVKGTRFNIGVDPRDGLLSQGAEGYALTWMDAKVGDLVVTPRRGKAVEINALWYNALSLLSDWLENERGTDASRPYRDLAERARSSFNRRFWNETGGYLYDIVDGENGDDSSFRPNQILAVSLRYVVLDPSRWARVIDQVKARLLTPVGLRSLAPDEPAYRSKYFGDLRARDLAYHQGTVWAWLIGPLVDAWTKAYDDPRGARALLEGFHAHLTEAGIGSISEIFDASAPFTPRGCIAQAWSVAEVLRCLVKTAPGREAPSPPAPAV